MFGTGSPEWVLDFAYAQAELAYRLGDLESARRALEVSGSWEREGSLRWLEYAIAGGDHEAGFTTLERLLGEAQLAGPIGNAEVERIYSRAFELVTDRTSAERLLGVAQRLPSDPELSPLVRLKLVALLAYQLQRWNDAARACDDVRQLGILDLELLQIEWLARRELGESVDALERELRRLDPATLREPIEIKPLSSSAF